MRESTTEREVRERFARETKNHVLTVLHDDGLYRHLSFRDPEDSAYWFELVTAPGSLTFQGDGTAFTFRRLRDMFAFFRDNPDRLTHRISPSYWAEKVVSQHAPAYGCLKEFSEELFNEQVAEELKEAEADHPGVTAAWQSETGGSWPDWETHHEGVPARRSTGSASVSSPSVRPGSGSCATGTGGTCGPATRSCGASPSTTPGAPASG